MTLILRGYKFIFIDESGFSEHTATVFGYAKIGKPCVVKNM